MMRGAFSVFALSLLIYVLLQIVPRFLFEDYTHHPRFVNISKPSGQIIQSRHGAVHYFLDGPSSGELIVMIHGITSDCRLMRFASEPLNEAGYRTLRFDLHGRGHSSSPLVDYSDSMYKNQTLDLLEALVKSQKLSSKDIERFHLLGYSLGGGIAVVTASAIPNRIKTLSLIAPVGVPFELPAIAKFTSLPGVAFLLENTFLGRYLLDSRIRPSFPDARPYEDIIQEIQMMNYHHSTKEGFLHAFLSTLLHFPGLSSRDLQSQYVQVGQETYPVLFIWGDQDKTVPYHCATKALQLIPRAQLITYPNTGHSVLYERAPQIGEDLFKFLSK